jgi:hypothetical protein
MLCKEKHYTVNARGIPRKVRGISSCLAFLMFEMPRSREDHRDAQSVASVD